MVFIGEIGTTPCSSDTDVVFIGEIGNTQCSSDTDAYLYFQVRLALVTVGRTLSTVTMAAPATTMENLRCASVRYICMVNSVKRSDVSLELSPLKNTYFQYYYYYY